MSLIIAEVNCYVVIHREYLDQFGQDTGAE